MPFQFIWEYEEVLEVDDSKSSWYYLSKTLPGSMVWKKMPKKIQLEKQVFCKLGSVLQVGYDYNAICVYLFVCLYAYLCFCDSVSL